MATPRRENGGVSPTHHSGIQLTQQLESGSAPRISRTDFPPEPVSGAVPRVWTDDEESHTDVSRSTVATALVCRAPAHPTLSIMTGARAGEVIKLTDAITGMPSIVLGRSHQAGVRLRENGVSRAHCRIYRNDQDEFYLEDLRSTNGTRVNGHDVSLARLESGDRIQIGETLVLQFGLLDDAEEALAQQLYDMSTRDPLTKAYNRRYFASRVDAELAHVRRHRTAMSLMLLDLDWFKSVNDAFGHAAGDAVLKAVVVEIQSMIRTEDLIARHGGEEFAILVRSANVQNAARLAERIRARVEALAVPFDGGEVSATISIGLAEANECANGTQAELLTLADRRLYAAKTLGRNRVVACD